MAPDVGLLIRRYTPSKQTIKERCTSVKAWELPKQDSALAPDHVWTNKDMDPVPPEDQTWTIWSECAACGEMGCCD